MSKFKVGLVKQYKEELLKKNQEQLVGSDSDMEYNNQDNDHAELLDTNKKLTERIELLEKEKTAVMGQFRQLRMKSYIKIKGLEEDLQQANKTIALLRQEIEKKGTHQNFVLDTRRYDIKSEDIEKMKEQGMSNYAIARVLKCSEGTVRNRLLGK